MAISAWRSGGDNLSPDDDPFWNAAAEIDMPVSIHLLLAAQQQKVSGSKAAAAAIGASAFSLTMPLITELIFQGVFDKDRRFNATGADGTASGSESARTKCGTSDAWHFRKSVGREVRGRLRRGRGGKTDGQLGG